MLEMDFGSLGDGHSPLLQHKSFVRKYFCGISCGGDAFCIVCTFILSLASLQSGYTIGYSSPTEDAITDSFNLSASQYSLFGSLPNVGALFGAIASGKMVDGTGRRCGLMVAAIPSISGWFAIALAKNPSILFVGRLLTGIGMGAVSFIVPVYVAEIAPKHLRGFLGTVYQLSITTGIFLAYLLGLSVSWRSMAAVGGIPCFLLVLGLWFVPESPRWLAAMGQEAKCRSALQILRGCHADIRVEESEIREAINTNNQQSRLRLDLFLERRYALPLIIGTVLLSLQQLSGINGVTFYSSSIFKSAGITSSNVATLILGIIQVFATAFTAWLTDKVGRRFLLLFSSSIMTVSLFVVGLAFYLKKHLQEYSQGKLLGHSASTALLVYIIGYSLGVGAIPWLIMSEILPARIKGVAGSIATLANWLSSFAVTVTFNMLVAWNPSGTFWIFASICGITFLFVSKYLPETKNKTLEEIQSLLQSN